MNIREILSPSVDDTQHYPKAPGIGIYQDYYKGGQYTTHHTYSPNPSKEFQPSFLTATEKGKYPEIPTTHNSPITLNTPIPSTSKLPDPLTTFDPNIASTSDQTPFYNPFED